MLFPAVALLVCMLAVYLRGASMGLAEAEEAAADDELPRMPKPARIRRPNDPLTP